MAGRARQQRVKLADRLQRKGPRKLLAIDGGGIRGVLSLQILDKIGGLLICETKRPDYRLADYFDYVAGTSTGGIIAAGIALGMSVSEILKFYEDNGPRMFDKASIIHRLQFQYKSEPLANQLQTVFGEATTLGSDEIETLLLLVMRNATTDSPWPISNNPYAKYNDLTHPACNLHFPLWQLVRASTAAPTYFPPEVITCGGKPFIFVDGGVTMYNNPAFQMFLMATVDQLLEQGAARKPRMGERDRQDARDIGRNGNECGRELQSEAERDAPPLQCKQHSLGAHVCGTQRAGFPV
jgi:patatin-like phospholipase/acyl hydrolase